MWSDNDIDNAFQRLNPPEPEPAPFPLDAWLRLETQLDKEEVARTVRRKVWRLVALEVLVVALAGLGWLLWKPTASQVAPAASRVAAGSAARSESQTLATAPPAQPSAAPRPQGTAGTKAFAGVAPALATTATTPAAVAKEASAPAFLAAPRNAYSAPIRPHDARVAATGESRIYAGPERRPTAGRDGRRLPALTVLIPRSHEASQPAVEKGQRRLKNAPADARRKSWAASVAAASDAQADASAANGRANRPSQPEQPFNNLSASTQNRTAAADALPATATANQVSTLDKRRDRAETDNSALPARPVAIVTALAPAAPSAPIPVAAETKVVAVAPEPRFFIGLVGAPDVSTVKFVSVEKPLLNLGLTLEYRFTNRLRLSTGLLRANKEYYARREDYDWTNYPRAQTRDFSWVEGKCTVLDVPLNLRYDAVVQDKARWFGSAGLSSFLMHRENYSYDYREGSDYKPWEMPGLVNANQHWLGVLNLSAGYERSLGPHWRLQAEPYVKVPLGGVGAGKVKLTSAGVFLGVKYGF